MGLLRWLRGDGDAASTASAAGALVELDASLSPAKRQQIENLETLEALRDDDAESAGTPRRNIDLDKGIATVRVRRARAAAAAVRSAESAESKPAPKPIE